MMRRRAFLRALLGAAPLVFAPKLSGWFRQGSGILVPRPEYKIGERIVIDYSGVFRVGDMVRLGNVAGTTGRTGTIVAIDNRHTSLTVDWGALA